MMKTFLFPILALFLSIPLSLAEQRQLETAGDAVDRKEVSMGMLGPRDTRIFHIFKEQAAVLVVSLGNKSAEIPISAKLHLFALETKEQGLRDWVNNQHSDGLIVNVPKPVQGMDLPKSACILVAKKKVGEKTFRSGPFDVYEVGYQIKDFAKKGVVSLKSFKDEAKVRVAKAP